jgi:hypothetical protein
MASRKISRQVRPAGVVAAVRTTGAAAVRPSVVRSARAILRGELDKIGLPTLLTIVEMERRSGIFVLSRGRQLGRLHVREGRIIRASTEGSRRLQGEEAVYQMLTWPDGRFELWMAEVTGRDEIEQCTAFLLMEGMRRIDEAAEQEDRPGLPANDIIFAY